MMMNFVRPARRRADYQQKRSRRRRCPAPELTMINRLPAKLSSSFGRLAAVLALALLLAVCCAPPALAASPDDNCRQMLINKQHLLSPDYAPSSLVPLSNYMRAGANVTMTAEAAAALGEMAAAMAEEGLTDIYGQSGYRSYQLQEQLNNNKIWYYRNLGYSYEQAVELACTVVAAPGASEHQSGLAIDLATSANGGGLTESFGSTPAGQWLNENCWKYGFILRYPADKTEITGYIYEPWHFRYVGQPHAEYMYRNNLCLEEYYALLQEEGILTYSDGEGVPYAVRLDQYNTSANLPDDELIAVSRAYADSELGFLITTTVPQIELFDITGHWAESYIRNLHSLGIIEGYSDNTFRPEKKISRAEMISLIYRTYQTLYPGQSAGSGTVEESPFADVPDGAYYLPALLALQELDLLAPGLIEEQADGSSIFLPDQDALRREMAQSLAPLFISLPDLPTSDLVLQDMVDADPQLQQAVQLLVDTGVVIGNASGNFSPDKTLSRAELSTMLDRVLSFFAGR